MWPASRGVTGHPLPFPCIKPVKRVFGCEHRMGRAAEPPLPLPPGGIPFVFIGICCGLNTLSLPRMLPSKGWSWLAIPSALMPDPSRIWKVGDAFSLPFSRTFGTVSATDNSVSAAFPIDFCAHATSSSWGWIHHLLVFVVQFSPLAAIFCLIK